MSLVSVHCHSSVRTPHNQILSQAITTSWLPDQDCGI